MEIVSQPEWDGIIEELIKNKGTALLLGTTNSGKSTLAIYLIEKFLSKGIIISLVDSDIGQSTIGLPGTISIKIFTPHLFKDTGFKREDFRYERMWFIGTLNPAKMPSLMIDVTKRVVNFAKKHSEIILIDTTGLVSGEVGKALKIGKIKAIEPEHIIAIERHSELQHIIELVDGINIHRVKSSYMAKIRSREARIKYRKEKFNYYFNESEIAEFLLDDVNFFYNGKPFYPVRKDISNGVATFKKSTLIGLNHGEDTKALGILVELIKNSITFKSPIKSLKGINRVVFGDIVLE